MENCFIFCHQISIEIEVFFGESSESWTKKSHLTHFTQKWIETTVFKWKFVSVFLSTLKVEQKRYQLKKKNNIEITAFNSKIEVFFNELTWNWTGLIPPWQCSALHSIYSLHHWHCGSVVIYRCYFFLWFSF